MLRQHQGVYAISHCIFLCLQQSAKQQPAEQKQTQQQHLPQPVFEGIKGTEAASAASDQLPTEFGEVKLRPASASPAPAQPAQYLRSEFGEVQVLGELRLFLLDKTLQACLSGNTASGGKSV